MTSTQSTPRSGKPADEAGGKPADKSEGKPAVTAADESAGKSEVASATGGKPTAARATLHYTLLRLALFVGTFAVLAALAWVGVIPEGIGKSNPLWLFALAILISAPLSLVLLRRQRDAMSEQIVPKVERASSSFKGRLAENRSREDEV